jgi:hypothetical protein
MLAEEPNELVFSKIKALLRKATRRTFHRPWDAIPSAIAAVATQAALSFFTASDYEPE